MAGFMLTVLVLSSAGIAQPENSTQYLVPAQLVGNWLGSHEYTRLDLLVPPQDIFPRLTFDKTLDVFSGRTLLKHAYAIPINGQAGTFSIRVNAQERVVRPDAISLLAFDRVSAIDRGSVRVSAHWMDRRMDEIEAAVNCRYDVSPACQPVENAGITLKAMLPKPFVPWYLQGELQTDGDESERATLLLAACSRSTRGSSITGNLGVTTQGYGNGAEPRQWDCILNWGVGWKRGERIRFGVLQNYYFDARGLDTRIFLELKPRAPAR